MSESRLAVLFAEIHELPEEEQAARLDELKADNASLAAQLEALIKAYHRNSDFLEQPVLIPHDPGKVTLALLARIGRLRTGTMVGPYEVLRPIGQGGMGQVYLVRQNQPIQRNLAMKIVSLRNFSESTIARFEIERQTLALLNHPYIARVVDGGTIEGDIPYFVMEYVEGQALDKFLRTSTTDIQARIQLFLKISDAIRHAHQKGVIHRDIKPSNILVERLDETLTPKVIDFGLAKWLVETDGLADYDSGEIRVLGTLPFVSPEQLQVTAQSADVRTDIYALGNVLYLLLTGSTPFCRESGSSERNDLELIRRIREDEPLPPSRFLAESLPDGSECCRTGFEKLPRTLADDLDWITLKCLEKQPGDRYESVAEMTADIRAALASMPVQAGPPGFWPRARKYLRRNKIRAAVTALVAMTFLTLALSYVQTRRAWLLASARLAETTRANQRLEAARLEIQQANVRLESALTESENFRAEAEKVTEFLITAFARPRPGQAGANLRVADVIRESVRNLMTSFDGNQAARGKLLLTLGNTLRAMGEYEEALPPLEMALKIESAGMGETAPDTLACVFQVGRTLGSLRRYNDAAVLYETWRERLEAANMQKSRQFVILMNNLARAYMSQRRFDEALPILRQIETIIPQIPAPEPRELAMVRQAIGEIYAATGDPVRAIEMQRESFLEIEKSLGPGNPQTIASRQALAEAMAGTDKAGAEMLIRENEKWIRAKIAPELPLFESRMASVAKAYGKIGKAGDQQRILKDIERPKPPRAKKATEN